MSDTWSLCVICQDDTNLLPTMPFPHDVFKPTKCSHRFHLTCARRLATEDRFNNREFRCPLCRTEYTWDDLQRTLPIMRRMELPMDILFSDESSSVFRVNVYEGRVDPSVTRINDNTSSSVGWIQRAYGFYRPLDLPKSPMHRYRRDGPTGAWEFDTDDMTDISSSSSSSSSGSDDDDHDHYNNEEDPCFDALRYRSKDAERHLRALLSEVQRLQQDEQYMNKDNVCSLGSMVPLENMKNEIENIHVTLSNLNQRILKFIRVCSKEIIKKKQD